jgi:hypothetical protein
MGQQGVDQRRLADTRLADEQRAAFGEGFAQGVESVFALAARLPDRVANAGVIRESCGGRCEAGVIEQVGLVQ